MDILYKIFLVLDTQVPLFTLALGTLTEHNSFFTWIHRYVQERETHPHLHLHLINRPLMQETCIYKKKDRPPCRYLKLIS